MRIGIIGAGMIGSTLAKLWVDAKHEIVLSSRHPDELEPMVKELNAILSWGEELAEVNVEGVPPMTSVVESPTRSSASSAS